MSEELNSWEEKTIEEKKAILDAAGFDLSDEELEQISGGIFKNPLGTCPFFTCTVCGNRGLTVTYNGDGSISSKSIHHICLYGRGFVHADCNCESCKFNKSGPFCGKFGISGFSFF